MTITWFARERNLQVKVAASARQERQIQKQMRFINRFRSKARKATQVQSRVKQLEKIKIIELPRAHQKGPLFIPGAPPRSGSEVIFTEKPKQVLR